MHPWIKNEAMKVETRIRTGLRMSAEFLKKSMFYRSTRNMTNAFEPFTHEPCWVVESPCVVTRVDSYRNEPCLGMLLATSCQLLPKSDVPIVAERLKAFLALTTRDEQAETSDIPRILSQVTQWQRDIMIFSCIATISYPNR